MLDLPQDEQNRIKEFYDLCTDLLKAKFILADAKIGKVLRALASSSELVNAVADSLTGFSFDAELNKAVIKNQLRTIGFRMPFEPNKIIALGYSLLTGFDAKRMDLNSFIYDYYDGANVPVTFGFEKFVREVVMPFRDELIAAVDYEPEKNMIYDKGEQLMFAELEDADLENKRLVGALEDEEDCEEELDYVQSFFYDLVKILEKLNRAVDSDVRLKSDRIAEINITIEALYQACELENLKIMNALLISLNFLLKKVRSVRALNEQLERRVAEFYAGFEADDGEEYEEE